MVWSHQEPKGSSPWISSHPPSVPKVNLPTLDRPRPVPTAVVMPGSGRPLTWNVRCAVYIPRTSVRYIRGLNEEDPTRLAWEQPPTVGPVLPTLREAVMQERV